MPVGALLNVDNGAHVKAGDIIARIPRGDVENTRHHGGLPRVAELFEARRPKDFAIISEIDGQIEFGKDYKSKRRIVVKPTDGKASPRNISFRKASTWPSMRATMSARATRCSTARWCRMTFSPSWASRRSLDYLINEIQDVYRLQGVKINDKHIEVIIRQMLQKVEISDAGDTTFIAASRRTRKSCRKSIRRRLRGQASAVGTPLLQGITKASLQTRSFISAASFQETTRVLTRSRNPRQGRQAHRLEKRTSSSAA